MQTSTVFFLLLLGFAFAYQIQKCPKNEHFATCGSFCPPTCQNSTPAMCPYICVRGCFCNKGYVREAKDGRCVAEVACEDVPKCKDNEIFSSCATLCPKTCEIEKPKLCPLVCITGCTCKKGFIRERSGGKCVPEVSCPKAITEVCKENEEYKRCGTSCPGTCSDPLKNCEKDCCEGCFCKEGYILDDRTLQCIKVEECPNETE